jgi:hypothetical protein
MPFAGGHDELATTRAAIPCGRQGAGTWANSRSFCFPSVTVGAELYLNKESEGSFLESLGGKKIAKLTALVSSFDACRLAAYTDEVRPVSSGDVVCIKGNSGQYALAFVLGAPSISDESMTIDLIVTDAS